MAPKKKTRNSNTRTLKEQAWSEILYNNTDLPEIQILVVRQYTRLCIWSTLRTETKKVYSMTKNTSSTSDML